MSTIASPRPSTSIRSPSSTRASFDSGSLAAPNARQPSTTRRNRAALRDYYGIKAAANANVNPNSANPEIRISEESTRSALGPELEEETLTELDKEGFDAEAYVQKVLATSGLEGVLRVEADLVSQIRNLDSDRKSLVYDNYSKLLAATSTIRRMRTNMDPLAPTTHTLSPAISHIAETAASLARDMGGLPARPTKSEDAAQTEAMRKKQKEKATVRWVLDAPLRLRTLLAEDKSEEADAEWEHVKRILEKWGDVDGVRELRETCEEIMEEEDGSE